jgi:hypothetical protein
MQSDIELAITDFGNKNILYLVKLLPSAIYNVIDRSAQGYGLVIRCDTLDEDEEINVKIRKFLAPLANMEEKLTDHGCILRIAIYSSLATTTVLLSCLDILDRYKAKAEISVYPIE